MMRTPCFPAVLLLAGLSAAQAADTAPVALSGDYYFYSDAQKDGRPVCSERWRFAPDGGMTIFSGQEVVTARFRVEVTKGDHGSEQWLVRTALSTNGQSDCRGVKSSSLPAGEERIYFYVAKTGNLVLANNIGGTGKGRVLTLIGLVYRAPEGGQP